MDQSVMWWRKYEPTTFKEMILNNDVREILAETFKKIPNLMLVGPPGVGKGTFARIFLNETKLDHIWINASDEAGIDTMRTKVKSFGRAMGLGGLKLIIMNEADRLSPAAQEALREEIEFVADITRFMFLVNTTNVFIDPIISRFRPIVEISKPPVKDIWDHCLKILESENIKDVNKVVLKDMIKELYPDIRGIVNTLQMSIKNNKLDRAVYMRPDEAFQDVLNAMKRKDLDEIRKILRSTWISYPDLYAFLFDNVGVFNSPGDAILSIGEALRWDSLVAIKEINFMTMVVDMSKRNLI